METFRCDPFGIVTIIRRHGAKNIRINIEAESISVSADYHTSERDIVLFIEKNRDTIIERQQDLRAKKKFITEDSRILNRFFSLSVCRDKTIKRHLFVLRAENNCSPYEFTMRCNESIDFSDNRTQEMMLDAVNKIIRNVAQVPLRERTMQIADELGFEVNSVKTKIEKTRWGSCSSSKNINLSAYLILLPTHLMDFVIIHELCHLREMNHSRRFHELVNKYTGSRESELEKELKKYSTNILDYTEQADV